MAPRKTLVALIQGTRLVSLFSEYHNLLFNLNIRLPLTTKKVNPDIVATAANHPRDFFYYNNGVSAVASSFELAGGTVTARRFQIINGAQTVSALYTAAASRSISKVQVLFRLTETAEEYGGDFTEKIIRYNNTQNPVKVSDFFSNDRSKSGFQVT